MFCFLMQRYGMITNTMFVWTNNLVIVLLKELQTIAPLQIYNLTAIASSVQNNLHQEDFVRSFYIFNY